MNIKLFTYLLPIFLIGGFLFIQPQTVQAEGSPQTVTVSVYYDYNSNGIQDVGEPNVPGYSISIKTYQCAVSCPVDDAVQPDPITTETSPIMFSASENRRIDVILPQSAASANGLRFYNSTTLQRVNGPGSPITYTISPDGSTSFSSASSNLKHADALLVLGTSGNLENANWHVKFALRPLNPVSVSCSPSGGQVIGNSITWNSSASGGVQSYSYEWNFDGGGFSPNSSSVTRTYSTNFNKSAQVRVTDIFGRQATSGVCNMDLVIPPPKPAISVNISCIEPNYSGNGVVLSWTNSDRPVYFVDIGEDPNFGAWFGMSVNTAANASVNIAIPNGYPGLLLQPGRTYYVRLYNGVHSSPPHNGFTIPSCQVNAACVSHTIPASMNANETRSVSVTMSNPPTSRTWTAWNGSNGFRLGSQDPQDNTLWGTGRVDLTTSTTAGNNATFTFNITAPATPGTYSSRWRMVEEFVQWFGETCGPLAVVVNNLPPSLRVQPLISNPSANFGLSGNQSIEASANKGSDFYNPMIVTAISSSATKYYVAFYDKSTGLVADKNTFLASIQSKLKSNIKSGFLLMYDTGSASYYVWDANANPPNGGWQTIFALGVPICPAGTTSCSTNDMLYRVNWNVPTPASWRVEINSSFLSKDLYTAVMIEDGSGGLYLSANATPTP